MTRPLTAFLVTLLAVSILFPFQPSGAKQEWVEVRSPNFIVVSNAGEKEARKTAVHFEQIRAVFSTVADGGRATPFTADHHSGG
jgi:hypothetical protein